MSLLEKIRTGIIVGLTGLTFVSTTYFVGKKLIDLGEKEARSKPRFYQPSEGPNLGRWVDGMDEELGSARLFGGFGGLVVGSFSAVGAHAGLNYLSGKIKKD